MAGDEPIPSEGIRLGATLGRYVLVRLLGEGGMGAVYEATHRELGKRVAVKILHAQYARSPPARLRFLREAQAASRIAHPNVADVYDVVSEGARPYLVMELLEGEALSQRLRREGVMSVRQAADVLSPVAAGVAAAHDHGIVHRDLKPENIFLSVERGGITPKVLDFGISKLTGDADVQTITDTGSFLGTPYYVSPEQAQGAKEVDARSDQYALGVVLYECVTGQRPFQAASSYALIQQIVMGRFRAPREIVPGLPGEFEALILQAMEREPARRFPTTRAFALALLRFAGEAVRRALEGELASRPEANERIVVGEAPERATLLLQTTLGQSTHERGPAVRASTKWHWVWAAALLLFGATAVLGLRGVWPPSKSASSGERSGIAGPAQPVSPPWRAGDLPAPGGSFAAPPAAPPEAPPGAAPAVLAESAAPPASAGPDAGVRRSEASATPSSRAVVRAPPAPKPVAPERPELAPR